MKYLTQREYQPIGDVYPELARSLPECTPTEAIGVDVAAIGRLATVGGFYPDVQIRPGKKESPGGMPLAAMGDGVGVSVWRISQTVRPRATLADSSSQFNFHTYRYYRHLSVEVDPELAEQVGAQGKLYDSQAWARALDGDIKQTICNGVWKNLVKQPPVTLEAIGWALGVRLLEAGTLNNIAYAMLDLAGVAPTSSRGVDLDAYSPGIYLGGYMTATLMKGLAAAIERLWSGREVIWSAIPGWHLDRALAVSALARARPLVASLR